MNIQASNFGNKSRLKCGFFDGKYNLAGHVHQLSEIIVVTGGELYVTIDGKRELARCGDAVYIPPFAPHEFSTPDHCRIWICLFSHDFVSDILSTADIYSIRERSVFPLKREVYAYAESRLIDNRQNFVELNAQVTRDAKTLLHVLCADYVSNVQALEESDHINSALISILVYINEHYKEDVTREQIADALGYHPGYVSRCCNMINGMNLRKFLNSARIDRAKELLVMTNFKIIDIALECGFTCERSLHRAFLEIAGCTPGEYRKRKMSQKKGVPR
jgi:AraC-like DNA-binding protein